MIKKSFSQKTNTKKPESRIPYAKSYGPAKKAASSTFTPRVVSKGALGTNPYPHRPSRTKTVTKSVPQVEVMTKTSGVEPETSWGPVASWYDDHLEKSGNTYHEKVVYPNVLRILGEPKGTKILDLACGQGQFSYVLAQSGASVIGVDVGKELIEIAEKKNKANKFNLHYFVSPSDDLYMVKDNSQDTVICILALQNIEKLQETINEVSRVLKKGGRFIVVINHPSFRNPKKTHWGYDEKQDAQYRRVDEYMSESHIKIDMTPGSYKDKKFTVSFHRPLQVYVKAFLKKSLPITRIEEWVSHKESEKGPRQKAENISRKEIPLFMCIEGTKYEA